MDRFPQMLFKAGGPEQFHGGNFSTLIVDSDEALDAAQAEGWHLSTTDALAALEPKEPVDDKPPADTPPTRAELEQKAADLGLTFTARTSDNKLAAAIAAKLAEAGA